MTVRCGNCDYWLGESAEPVVFVDHVPRSAEVGVQAPRDLRLCKACGRVNVFVARKDLDSYRARVAS